MSPVALLVIILSLAYLAWTVYCQYQQTESHKRRINSAHTAWQQSEQDSRQKKKELFQEIAGIYGEESAARVDQGKIWMGMPVILLPLAAGKAQDTRESLYRSVKTEKWYYGRYLNRLGNAKYTLEVTIENGAVAGWRDLP